MSAPALKKAKQLVLREWPSAYYDPDSRCILRYTEGLPPLGVGSVLAPSTEESAWADAARQIRRVSKGSASK